MGLRSSKCSPTWKNDTTSNTSKYRGTTLVLTGSPNMCTSTSDKRYSRPAMETNRGGILSSPPSCGPTESRSADVWAAPHTSQPLAHILFFPSTSRKQPICFLCLMPLFPQLTLLLGALSPCRNVNLTSQHSPPMCMPLESKPPSILNKSMPPPSSSTTSNSATSSSSEIPPSRSLSIAKCVQDILVCSSSYHKTRVAPTSSPNSTGQSSTVQLQHSE